MSCARLGYFAASAANNFFGKTILFQVDRVISEPISNKRRNVAKNEEKKKTFKSLKITGKMKNWEA